MSHLDNDYKQGREKNTPKRQIKKQIFRIPTQSLQASKILDRNFRVFAEVFGKR
jgi:hypothetical protein